MKFGVFYEHQLPRPWSEDDEYQLLQEALEQVVLADGLGFDYAWEVEHHFLDEYSHSSAPEVFLAAAAARTTNIRLGHGIRQVIANYNHPVRTAETLATLDLMSNGRVDFGIGEGATRLELGGFDIPVRKKRAMSFEAAEQIANMMVMEPYPGYDGEHWSMPCRNVIPKPRQK
ncbi:MAG: LLM class flavin-dependent oxidoreductase, partial [Acidimicrobiales bacterium]